MGLWTMGTYIYRAFTYYPYLHFNGEKESGKTTALDLLQEIAFNSVGSIDVTSAVLFA
jgi:hypothetical protein